MEVRKIRRNEGPNHRVLPFMSPASATFFLVGLVGLMVGACSFDRSASSKDQAADGAEKRASSGLQVQTEVVVPERFVEEINVNATVITDEDVLLSARIGGTVTAVTSRGTEVQRGQVVVQLDPALARAELSEARANLEVSEAVLDIAQARFSRQQPLFERKVISDLEMEDLRASRAQAEAQVAQARARFEQAKEQLELTRVDSPIRGRVEETFVDVGEQVTAGVPMARVVDVSTVKVRGAVPERYARDIEVGSVAQVEFNAYGLPARTSKLTFVSRVIDPQSRTFAVETELDNPDGELKPEMVARLTIDRSVIQDALSVPQTAVLSDNEGQSLFVVKEGDVGFLAQRRRVEVGARTGGRVVIESGLEAGDRVVVVGHTSLATGDVVEVVREAAP